MEWLALEIFLRPDDGLDREFNIPKWLEGGMCTMCAPRDQEKSCDGQAEQSVRGVMRMSGSTRSN
jgi:hypothetical protein